MMFKNVFSCIKLFLYIYISNAIYSYIALFMCIFFLDLKELILNDSFRYKFYYIISFPEWIMFFFCKLKTVKDNGNCVTDTVVKPPI